MIARRTLIGTSLAAPFLVQAKAFAQEPLKAAFMYVGPVGDLGWSNALRVGRSFTLPGGDRFDGDLGVSARSGGSARLVGSMRYAKALPTGRLEARFDRGVSLNANNVDVASTLVGLTLSHEISAVSDLSVRADYSRTDGGTLGGVTNAASRQAIRASYSRDLTRDWSLETGYQYRHLRDGSSRSASSNSVFLTIGRTFVALR